MIKKNTVFILGAGASRDFGYPLGEALRSQIISKLSVKISRDALALAKVLTDSRLPPKILEHEIEKNRTLISEFTRDLNNDADYSIDAFLERFSNKYLMIGKMTIAYILSKCENQDNLFSNNSWYRILYKKMKEESTIDTFDQNKVAFVTFNYDRSLEHFLYTALNSFHEEITLQKVVEIISKIPIIHLYGQLDPLPWQGLSEDVREYGEPYTPAQFKKYAYDIGIVFENMTTEVDLRFNRAFKLLKDADRVYTLGFGFHEENIKRLRLDEIIKNPSVLFEGTALGIDSQEMDNIRRNSFAKFDNHIEHDIPDLFLKKPQLHSETVYDFISKRAELD